jgi:thioredoxin reductase
MSKAPDVPIIGGGPAGMSCALWLANYGLNPIIVERAPALGGMAAASPYPDDWLLGRPGETARQNAEAFALHIREVGVACWFGAHPQRVHRQADGRFVIDVAYSDGRPPQPVLCPAVVVATGTQFGGADWLDATANARALAERGRVHLGPGWAGEPTAEVGSHVAVIGGGDNAFDVARMLGERGAKATIIMRSKSPRAQPLLVERLGQHQERGTATVMAGRTVVALEAAGSGVRLGLSDGSAIEADHVVVLFGYRPNTDQPWLSELTLAKDPNGYLTVDGNMETSCRGIFAAGDIANPVHPCIATAVAGGTMAAREIQRRLASR